MKSEQAKTMYGQFLDKLGKAYDPAKIQGDYMFPPQVADIYSFV
jgi:D-tyrosyl-tRNA(Tyr) deacylase